MIGGFTLARWETLGRFWDTGEHNKGDLKVQAGILASMGVLWRLGGPWDDPRTILGQSWEGYRTVPRRSQDSLGTLLGRSRESPVLGMMPDSAETVPGQSRDSPGQLMGQSRESQGQCPDDPGTIREGY